MSLPTFEVRIERHNGVQAEFVLPLRWEDKEDEPDVRALFRAVLAYCPGWKGHVMRTSARSGGYLRRKHWTWIGVQGGERPADAEWQVHVSPV